MLKSKIVTITLLFAVIFNIYAQVEKQEENTDTSTVIYGWVLDEDLLNIYQTQIDTLLTNYQLYTSQKKLLSNYSSNGGNGSVYLSNIFFDRNYDDDLLFLRNYEKHLYTFKNTQYLNTRKPFSHLFYLNGDSKPSKDEAILLQHSQNVNPKFNVGIKLNIHSNKGQYKYIATKNRNFKAHGSYSGSKYQLHATLNYNQLIGEENGGINDSSFKTAFTDTKHILTNYKGNPITPYNSYVTNKIRYIDGMLSQRLKLFTIQNTSDSAQESQSKAEPILSHVFIYRRAAKIYTEKEEMYANPGDAADNLLYNTTYLNERFTYDSLSEVSLLNKLQLDFKTTLKKNIVAGVYGSINHEYKRYSYYSAVDSILQKKGGLALLQKDATQNFTLYNSDTNLFGDIRKRENVSNIFIEGGIYGKFWTYFNSDFSGRLYLLGRNAGETSITGKLISQAEILKTPIILSVQGNFENKKPSYQLTNYYSNHYIWEQNFDFFINKVHLSSKLAAPSKKFEVLANYALFSNFIYFTDSLPVPYKTALNILAFTAQKEFKFWKIRSLNKITYQVSENRSIVEIPQIVLFNSTYFDHTWSFKPFTEGKLRTMLGFDLNYTTSFNGQSYLPALSTFYQDGNFQIGNYPFVDAWLNVRLKRTRFFIKYEHLTNLFLDRKSDTFLAAYYPALQERIMFGLSWTFYN